MTPEETTLELKFQALLEIVQSQQAIMVTRAVRMEEIERKLLTTMAKIERHLYVSAIAQMHAADPEPPAIDLAMSLVDNIEAGEDDIR